MTQVFFLTGSSRGLGRQIAEAVLAAGHSLVATARNPVRLADLGDRYGDRILPVALDVGRHTFAVYDRLELGLLAAWLVLGLWSADRPRWYLAVVVPGVVVAAEALWLLPALDRRVAVVLAGGPFVDDPVLHTGYIAGEVVKAAALLLAGSWRRD